MFELPNSVDRTHLRSSVMIELPTAHHSWSVLVTSMARMALKPSLTILGGWGTSRSKFWGFRKTTGRDTQCHSIRRYICILSVLHLLYDIPICDTVHIVQYYICGHCTISTYVALQVLYSVHTGYVVLYILYSVHIL